MITQLYGCSYLNIVFTELFSKRFTSSSKWIDGIVYRDLAILMIQPTVNILAALFQNLLTKENGGSRGIYKEVVFWHVDVWAHCGTTIVTKVEDPGLDTKPKKFSKVEPY
jgi:hypothetical protein